MPIEPEACTILTARTLEDVEELRPIWTRMQWHPNADIDFFIMSVSLRENIIRPHVLVVTENGTPKTILVGRLETRTVPLKIGYKTIFCFKVRSLSMIYGGWMGDFEKTTSERLVRHLLHSISSGEADLLSFNMLPVDSPLYHSATYISKKISLERPLERTEHLIASIPNSKEALWNRLSPNTKKTIRSVTRRIIRTYGHSVHIECYQRQDDVASICDLVRAIMEHTYKPNLGIGFVNEKELKSWLELELGRKTLSAFFLFFEGDPVAFWIGYRYHNSFHGIEIGYKDEYRNFHPGIYLLYHIFEQLSEDQSVSELDFGFGWAEYKRKFSDELKTECTVNIWALRFLPMTQNILCTSFRTAETYVKWLTRYFGGTDRLKRAWRNRSIR